MSEQNTYPLEEACCMQPTDSVEIDAMHLVAAHLNRLSLSDVFEDEIKLYDEYVENKQRLDVTARPLRHHRLGVWQELLALAFQTEASPRVAMTGAACEDGKSIGSPFDASMRGRHAHAQIDEANSVTGETSEANAEGMCVCDDDDVSSGASGGANEMVAWLVDGLMDFLVARAWSLSNRDGPAPPFERAFTRELEEALFTALGEDGDWERLPHRLLQELADKMVRQLFYHSSAGSFFDERHPKVVSLFHHAKRWHLGMDVWHRRANGEDEFARELQLLVQHGITPTKIVTLDSLLPHIANGWPLHMRNAVETLVLHRDSRVDAAETEVSVFATFPRLKTLKMCDGGDERVAQLLSRDSCEGLEALQLQIHSTALLRVLAEQPFTNTLRTLSLNPRYDMDGDSAVRHLFEKLPNLTDLEIGGDGLQGLVGVLARSCPRLVAFNSSRTHLSEGNVVLLLGQLPELTFLSAPCARINEADARSIVARLPTLRQTKPNVPLRCHDAVGICTQRVWCLPTNASVLEILAPHVQHVGGVYLSTKNDVDLLCKTLRHLEASDDATNALRRLSINWAAPGLLARLFVSSASLQHVVETLDLARCTDKDLVELAITMASSSRTSPTVTSSHKSGRPPRLQHFRVGGSKDDLTTDAFYILAAYIPNLRSVCCAREDLLPRYHKERLQERYPHLKLF